MKVGDVELWPHQAREVERFADLSGCLVAYDRRGGKTITALALAQRFAEQGHDGPILIVSDKTSPWEHDIVQVGIPIEQLHLVDRPKRTKFRELLANTQPGHFYQIHWAGLVPELQNLLNVHWAAIIADEAHGAKNRNSQRTKALKKLRTKHKVALTADPDDNAPQDIWSLLNWLYPKKYTSFWRWVREYVELQKESGKHGDYFVFGKPINVEKFRAEIAPFFATMTLEEIDPGQIPIRYEQRVVTMPPEQAEAYHDMVGLQMMMLDDELVTAEYAMVAAMRLQQLAQSMGIATTRLVWRTRKRIDPITNKLVSYREQVETTRITQAEPSPKLDALMEILANNSGPTIVFSQYPGMVDLARIRMYKEGISYARVMENEHINDAQRRFQEGDVDVIIGTTGHMSESIKLDRADTIVFLDYPWNPRVRGQAEGRARAVGKRTPITCIDIRTRDTVDYGRLDRVRTKQEWKDAFLGRNYNTT